MLKVLVSGVGTKTGLGILKGLKKSRIPKRVVGMGNSPSAGALYLLENAFLNRRQNEGAYLKRTAEIIRDEKIDVVLPEDRAAPALGWGLAVYPFEDAAKGFKYMPTLRAAIRMQHKVQISYKNAAGELSERTLRPLQLEYWGRVWTLTAWCELRDDFRVFRVDRMQSVAVLPSQFGDDVGKTLSDYLHQMGE